MATKRQIRIKQAISTVLLRGQHIDRADVKRNQLSITQTNRLGATPWPTTNGEGSAPASYTTTPGLIPPAGGPSLEPGSAAPLPHVMMSNLNLNFAP
ncbi:MAG: hypothetical protein [Cressdnaviricota sp.]|nr:MAG: hypothetical protein [Cressdnaviricota sp.]